MPDRANTTFQFFWEDRRIDGRFHAGVSLHSHTMYSEESLWMLPGYTARVPIARRAVDNSIDYSRAFWTPPLSPRQAYRLEEKQIQRQFQLPALVSLTDHDNIQAGMLLNVMDRFRHAPISTEWTVPFGPTFFHLGIHNVPQTEAGAIMEQLGQFTASPNPEALGSLLASLNRHPDVLIVLNHPLWDEKGIGATEHRKALCDLLKFHGQNIHALELNGLRSWNENRQIIALGAQTGVAVISGGDRHGREPNAILNLTRCDTFVQFVHEVRYRRTSHVVFMPQYHQSLTLRTIQTVIDILRDYPEVFEGRRRWMERVYYRHPGTNLPVTLASLWPKGNIPGVFKAVTLATKVAQTHAVSSLLRRAFTEQTFSRNAVDFTLSALDRRLDGEAAG